MHGELSVSKEVVDNRRRAFLTNATMAMAGMGLAAAAVPFIVSMMPSKAAEAVSGPIKVDLSKMKPGEQLTVMWRKKPIWIIRRTKESLENLKKLVSTLRDPHSRVKQQPAYARNDYRSINPEYLVLVGLCTHLGCVPTYRPDVGGVAPDWPGGFFCSCHGSKFDMAGRVYKGVPAPINLEVPPYSFIDKHTILIGKDDAK